MRGMENYKPFGNWQILVFGAAIFLAHFWIQLGSCPPTFCGSDAYWYWDIMARAQHGDFSHVTQPGVVFFIPALAFAQIFGSIVIGIKAASALGSAIVASLMLKILQTLWKSRANALVFAVFSVFSYAHTIMAMDQFKNVYGVAAMLALLLLALEWRGGKRGVARAGAFAAILAALPIIHPTSAVFVAFLSLFLLLLYALFEEKDGARRILFLLICVAAFALFCLAAWKPYFVDDEMPAVYDLLKSEPKDYIVNVFTYYGFLFFIPFAIALYLMKDRDRLVFLICAASVIVGVFFALFGNQFWASRFAFNGHPFVTIALAFLAQWLFSPVKHGQKTLQTAAMAFFILWGALALYSAYLLATVFDEERVTQSEIDFLSSFAPSSRAEAVHFPSGLKSGGRWIAFLADLNFTTDTCPSHPQEGENIVLLEDEPLFLVPDRDFIRQSPDYREWGMLRAVNSFRNYYHLGNLSSLPQNKNERHIYVFSCKALLEGN